MPHKDPEARRAWARAYREAHRERITAYNQEWRELHRAQITDWNKAWYENNPDKKRAKAEHRHVRYISNPGIETIANRIWRKANREKVNIITRRYQARKFNTITSSISIEVIKVRDRMLCCICGKKVTEKDFSLDHTIPLSLGGPHSQDNLRVAHRRCNSRRGAGRLPVQMVMI
jgi:5-methylcytosine-specific restriction endonuclease McrA